VVGSLRDNFDEWKKPLLLKVVAFLFGLHFFIPLISQNIKDKYKIRLAKLGVFVHLLLPLRQAVFTKPLFLRLFCSTTVILSFSRCFFVRKISKPSFHPEKRAQVCLFNF
jgi:hypothetical protein